MFLDVDGTLLELAATPSGVVVDQELKALLAAIAERLSGAVALVSGRSIERLDQLFAPLRLPVAGLHGVERRDASGAILRTNYADPLLHVARVQLAAFVATHPGTLLEDKGRSLALHFRLAPELEADARGAVEAAARSMTPSYHVQEGKKVFEIKPSGFSKASAIEEFLREPPFSGRIPVFAGDDLTDQAAFRAVESLGGIAIAVGDRLEAAWRLENPQAVRRWLAAIAALA